MSTTTITDSGVADTTISTMVQQVAEAAAAAVVEEGVRALPLPTRTSFALGSKQDRVLHVVSGDVNITYTTVLDKHVTLTPNRWAQLMSRSTSRRKRSIVRRVRWLCVRTLATNTTCPWTLNMVVLTFAVSTFHTDFRASMCVLHAVDSDFSSMSGLIC